MGGEWRTAKLIMTVLVPMTKAATIRPVVDSFKGRRR
jgi:hypothetical protein